MILKDGWRLRKPNDTQTYDSATARLSRPRRLNLSLQETVHFPAKRRILQ